MKEPITKFDLEAAFKALDEIEAPNVGNVKANRPALNEIFSRKTKFDALMEEYYDVGNVTELDDAKEAREAEVAQAKLARIEKIVDLDAESPEDLLPSYVGKFIIQCPQCMTLFYKNKEDVEASEDDPDVVNVNEVCQHCGNEAGYTLIGKVGEATEEETAEYKQENTVDVTSTDEDEEEFTDEIPEEPSEEELDIDLDELDLDIEDAEAEEKQEESFNTGNGEQPLVEELREEAELDVSADEFEKLISSAEFKKPISDTEARAMMDEADGDKVDESSATASEDLNNNKHLEEGILDKLKDKFADVVDKAASKLKSREAKADWLLANTMNDYNGLEVDTAGQLVPDKNNQKFKTFVVIGYTSRNNKGELITTAPDFDDTNLVIGKNGVQNMDKYDNADKFAKGWSMRQGNGPAFIYLAKGKDDDNALFLCEYFMGELKNDQLEKYLKIVKNELKGAKLMANSGMSSEPGTVNNEEASEEPTVESLDTVMSGIENLQEASLEKLISDSLIEAYGNVAGFRLVECAYVNNNFTVDGTIYFTSGNKRKTTYKFSESFTANDGKISFKGLNEKLGLDKRFELTGCADSSKTFITESFNVLKK